ncbi:MAG: hypothetical protein BMS9Abin02_0276 [Anaerolineae bacterium]|nr:MAG: hypothetical protein BMS9Abin02_0276 [Anaerolineae bacterium]
MKKVYLFVILLLLFSLALSACGSEDTAVEEEAAPTEEVAAPAVEEEAAPAEEEEAPVEEAAAAGDYTAPEPAFNPVPLEEGAQAACSALGFSGDKPATIAYMPPATEFNYYQAIGAGIDDLAAELGIETFMLAPQSGSDIEGQMGMIQDVLTQDVDAIILSTHDEFAAAPLVEKAISQGVAVIIVNSDIANFPTPVNGVVGYSQRSGTFAEGEYILDMFDGQAKVGVLEGLPGYHSTERIGGYLDAFEGYDGMEVIASLPTEWNVETGNTAMMDLLQANPEIEVVITANDYIAIGAALAAEALGRDDVAIFGNDGDTTGLEDIAAGKWDATVNTTPYLMGQVALQVTVDCLEGVYPGGWTETPTVIVDASNANDYLCRPENLFPAPSQEYECGAPAEEATAAGEYTAPEPAFNPVPLEEGAQAACTALGFSGDQPATIAYMPPATEFNYYQAIGAGIDDLAAELGIETFMLAPQSGSDIEGQMGMIQDVLTQDVDAIILSTHDEFAAAPLVEKAISQGVAVIIVNSDIANFPTPVNGVVGYSQRSGTFAEGEYILDMFDGQAKVGVLEGLPGYHSTERIGGYLDAFEGYDGMEVIASLPTEWNVETGNTAMMDLLQANPEIEVVITANDYIAIGAALAAEALGRDDVAIFGNDGDTTGLEDIAAGKWDATVNTTPYLMGQVALQVAVDCLDGVYPGGWTETPTVIVDASNANDYLCRPENLFPAPSQEYECNN